MSFLNLDIKDEYRSLSHNVVEEFYTPILSESIIYQRAVGFFSSTALLELSRGITHLVRNGGKIQVVASPRLSEEDINAINKGIELRDEIIVKNLKASLYEATNYFEEERLNLICNLIAKGILEIRIAFMVNESDSICMYHEKMGLMMDEDDNTIAFTGSMNETATAFNYNYETIEVYKTWTHDRERVINKQRAFNTIWENNDPYIKVEKFEEVESEILKKYRKNNEINLEIDYKGYSPNKNNLSIIDGPKIPQDIKLYEYQLKAIENWKEHRYVGIFDMATGTGKTYTALGAICRLFSERKALGVIIVCPYTHLVEQWVTDIEKFSMKPIIGYSSSKQKDWYVRLSSAINSFNLNTVSFFCFITTNATFRSDRVQSLISDLGEKILIIVDEAHNFGAEKLRLSLPKKVEYRIALSATLERKGDDEGTQELINYFGERCITYTLEDAINAGKLTPYKYYPIIVLMNEDEIDEYRELTKKIIKSSYLDKNGKRVTTESGKILLIKRAQLIAGVKGKLSALRREIQKYREESHMLIYCGATTINEEDEENSIGDCEIRQIDAVIRMLGKDLEMKVAKFTSEEDRERRNRIKKSLADGDMLQAIVAIRCLDEGVDIPSIKTAFILASSTNPKEYIQRRGRVLRKFPGKKYAEIYDFVTLPYYGEIYNEEVVRNFKGLAKRELARIEDFSNLAMNSSYADEIIANIKRLYSIVKEESEEDDGII